MHNFLSVLNRLIVRLLRQPKSQTRSIRTRPPLSAPNLQRLFKYDAEMAPVTPALEKLRAFIQMT